MKINGNSLQNNTLYPSNKLYNFLRYGLVNKGSRGHKEYQTSLTETGTSVHDISDMYAESAGDTEQVVCYRRNE